MANENPEGDLGNGPLPQGSALQQQPPSSAVEVDEPYDPSDTDITNPNIQRGHVLAQWHHRNHTR